MQFSKLDLGLLMEGRPVARELHKALFGKCHVNIKQIMLTRASSFQSTDPRDAE